jgi:hypothetical protein
LALVRIAVGYTPLLELAGNIPTFAPERLLREALANTCPRDYLSHPPPHTSVVRESIRFFNGCLPSYSTRLSPSKPAKYVLRHWVGHLWHAVRWDTSLDLEFLQKRNHKGTRKTEIFDSEVSASIDFLSLEEDMLSAQSAIEDRVRATYDFFTTILMADCFFAPGIVSRSSA